MTVRAKFYVTSIQHHHTQSPGYVCAEIKLAPVYGDENKPWSQATPQGQIADDHQPGRDRSSWASSLRRRRAGAREAVELNSSALRLPDE
jgi:hypothetical protein